MPSVARVVDLAEEADNAALRRFYDDLILPAFPTPSELDDVDEWEADLAKGANDGSDSSRHELDPELHVLLALDASNAQLGGLVYEVYPRPAPETGIALVSYLVTAPHARRQGVSATLMARALQALAQAGISLCLTEVHKLHVHDGTPMDTAARHCAFDRLGFRPLRMRYEQPPLTPDKPPSRGLLLLAHAGLLGADRVPTSQLFAFLDGFCGSVFGFDAAYAATPYFALADAQLTARAAHGVPLATTPAPWQTKAIEPAIVAVVGAGLAGLAAAAALRDRCADGVQAAAAADGTAAADGGTAAADATGIVGHEELLVIVVEARDRVGGRVHPQTGLVPWGPVDLGAEFVHGLDTSTSPVAKLLHDEPMTPCFDVSDWGAGTANAHDGGEQQEQQEQLVAELLWTPESGFGALESDPVARRARRAVDQVFEDEALDPRASLLDLLADEQDEATLAVVDAVLAQTEAADLSSCGAASLAAADEAWSFGDDNVRPARSHQALLDALSSPVVTKWPVREVEVVELEEDGAGTVNLTARDGRALHGLHAVVLAVPPPLLADASGTGVRVEPSLPPTQQLAIAQRTMQGGVKVLALVRSRFWQRGAGIVIVGDREAAFSQIWFNEGDDGDGPVLVVGFATASRAERLRGKSDADKAAALLAQLDRMWPQAAPVGDMVLRTAAKDWAEEDFSRGAYAAPQVVSEELWEAGLRDEEQVKEAMRMGAHGGRVWFAGEAFNAGTCGTTQAAILSGRRAAADLLSAAGVQ